LRAAFVAFTTLFLGSGAVLAQLGNPDNDPGAMISISSPEGGNITLSPDGPNSPTGLLEVRGVYSATLDDPYDINVLATQFDENGNPSPSGDEIVSVASPATNEPWAANIPGFAPNKTYAVTAVLIRYSSSGASVEATDTVIFTVTSIED